MKKVFNLAFFLFFCLFQGFAFFDACCQKVKTGNTCELDSFRSFRISKQMSTQLNSVSGIASQGEFVYAITDNGNKTIYKLNRKTLRIVREFIIPTSHSKDWEEITSDGQYVYVAATGTNKQENKTELAVLRIPLVDLEMNLSPLRLDSVLFRISYGIDPNCEAMFALNNKLHLFNKKESQTAHFVIPCSLFGKKEIITIRPTELVQTCNTLITAAAVQNNKVLLLGYKKDNCKENPLPPAADCKLLSFQLSDDKLIHKKIFFLGKEDIIGQLESLSFTGNDTIMVINEAGDLPCRKPINPTFREYKIQ